MGEVCLFCVGRGALDLIPVVVQAGDFAAGEEGDFASGTADAAADVENLHALLQVETVCHVVLMASECLQEALVDAEAAEVERLGPAFLVEIRDQVVVAASRVRLFVLGCHGNWGFTC